jgi:dTDP-4-dehydrorhamnose 3,5-epimerase
MKFIETPLKNLWLIEPEIKTDSRGFLARLFCEDEFSKILLDKKFVQENLTLTKTKGTFRGFHYQLEPFAEKKLVRCISGKVIDIVIDLRKDSDTFLKNFSVVLDSEKLNMILIPEGFAHGFQTLTDNCLMLYSHTNVYNSEYERGINIDDPILDISLKMPIKEISERDKNHIFLTNNFKAL